MSLSTRDKTCNLQYKPGLEFRSHTWWYCDWYLNMNFGIIYFDLNNQWVLIYFDVLLILNFLKICMYIYDWWMQISRLYSRSPSTVAFLHWCKYLHKWIITRARSLTQENIFTLKLSLLQSFLKNLSSLSCRFVVTLLLKLINALEYSLHNYCGDQNYQWRSLKSHIWILNVNFDVLFILVVGCHCHAIGDSQKITLEI